MRVLVVIFCLILFAPKANSATACAIAKDGKPLAVIVVSQRPNESAWFAAGELRYHLQLITGADFPIVNDSEAQQFQGVKILVGESSITKKLGYSNNDFAPQEYLIQCKSDYVLLMGRDDLSNCFPLKRWGNPKSVEGKFGRAIFLDGKSDVIAVRDPQWHDECGTIQFWIKIDGASSGNIIRIEGQPWSYHLISQNGRKIRYQTFDGKNGTGIESDDLSDGWHYVAATYAASAQKQELFIDGKSCGSGRYYVTQCKFAELLGVGAIVEPFSVGERPQQLWRGCIDELKISKLPYDGILPGDRPPVSDKNTIIRFSFDEETAPLAESSGLIRTNSIPDAFSAQGTCYAVYDFLERFCGVRWYAPGELGIVFDKMPTLRLPVANIRRKPAFEFRWST